MAFENDASEVALQGGEAKAVFAIVPQDKLDEAVA
jgi:hypothetical protein